MIEDKRGNQRRLNKEQVEAIFKLHTEGATTVDISKFFGVYQRAIIQILKGETYKDIPRPEGYKYQNNARKLNDRQVRKIRKSDKSLRLLARHYKVSMCTISRIKNNIIYSNIK